MSGCRVNRCRFSWRMSETAVASLGFPPYCALSTLNLITGLFYTEMAVVTRCRVSVIMRRPDTRCRDGAKGSVHCGFETSFHRYFFIFLQRVKRVRSNCKLMLDRLQTPGYLCLFLLGLFFIFFSLFNFLLDFRIII
jgi:hypothetical protein